MASQVPMGDGRKPSLGADHRGLKVIELQPALEGTGLRYPDGQHTLASLGAGPQLRIHPLDPWVLLQEL